MVKRSQRALVGLRVRMREPLRKQLEVAAKKRGVSLNAELVSRLEQSFQINSFEQVAEAQQDTIRRWAQIAQRYEILQRSLHIDWDRLEKGDWKKLPSGYLQKTAEKWREIIDADIPVITEPSERPDVGERSRKDERQHHPARQK
jgi:Arc-like DNA binding domain